MQPPWPAGGGRGRPFAPAARVIDHDSVLNAVGGVVNLSRVRGVDELDGGAVGDDGGVLFVHADSTLESTVNLVAAQQGGTLVEVVVGVLTNNNRAELGAGAGGALQQNAGQQAADTAKTVEHNVL